MTNKAERRYQLFTRLERAGFSYHEAEALRRIEMRLSRWGEHECNGTIQRDEETDLPYWYGGAYGDTRLGRAADREKGALKRLAAIMADHPDYVAHHQSDPRGCALYIVARHDLEDGARDLPVDEYYTRGIAVCAS